jgi:hypothetical protein
VGLSHQARPCQSNGSHSWNLGLILNVNGDQADPRVLVLQLEHQLRATGDETRELGKTPVGSAATKPSMQSPEQRLGRWTVAVLLYMAPFAIGGQATYSVSSMKIRMVRPDGLLAAAPLVLRFAPDRRRWKRRRPTRRGAG